MKQLYPDAKWDPEDPLIRGERIFAGEKGKNNIRPMTIAELKPILDSISHAEKKAYWAKELRRRINNWTWQNPRGPS